MSTAAGLIVMAGRILVAVFFGVFAGVGHVRRSGGYETAATTAKFPIPRIAGWPTGLG